MRNLIRENRIYEIHNVIETSRALGMQTMDTSIKQLYFNGKISKEDAVRRVKPEQVEFFLHPQIEPGARKAARVIAKGLNVSPGAAVGIVALRQALADLGVLDPPALVPSQADLVLRVPGSYNARLTPMSVRGAGARP